MNAFFPFDFFFFLFPSFWLEFPFVPRQRHAGLYNTEPFPVTQTKRRGTGEPHGLEPRLTVTFFPSSLRLPTLLQLQYRVGFDDVSKGKRGSRNRAGRRMTAVFPSERSNCTLGLSKRRTITACDVLVMRSIDCRPEVVHASCFSSCSGQCFGFSLECMRQSTRLCVSKTSKITG